MARDCFPPGVAEQLNWYVYRLIDPRNGQTFYVGKGQGNRVFAHANGRLTDGADEISDPEMQPGAKDSTAPQKKVEADEISDPKMQLIREIKGLGLEVSHVIHRHGMSEKQAYEVEAALIDAYPGLLNKVRGRGSRDYGSRHVEEIINEYVGEEFVVEEPLMLITVNNTYSERGCYDAVRHAWPLSLKNAETYQLVLARLHGLVVGAYRPTEWKPATPENFPDLEHKGITAIRDRIGFVGEEAEPEILNKYVNKRVPAKYRNARNPVRYLKPETP